MYRTRHALRLALGLTLFLGGAAFLPRSVATAGRQQPESPRRPKGPATGPVITLPRGEAESNETTTPAKGTATLKWEYCAIVRTTPRQTGFNASPAKAVIRHYPNNYEEVEGKDEEDALANAFARLGDDGWELIAIKESLNLLDGSGRSAHVYFFKRPK